MPSNNVMSEKKKALMAHKAKILEEMKYYETRIDQVRSQGLKTSFTENADSSDSEEDFPFSVECGPSVPQLKLQQAMLKTCLQATQELTSLQVLQSEVNVLVDSPEIVGEPPVTEPGVWREVTAECRVDLVPFSITYLVHQPDRQFGPPSYRCLRVLPVKSAHEGELSKSVMPSLSRPSDAVEVLKSYAAAQRSRRSTLARLADKYANMLFMEPMLVAGDLLHISQPAVSRIVAKISRRLAAQHGHQIKYPANMSAHRQKFMRLGQYQQYQGLQNVDGAIDCTHIKIVDTPGVQHHEAYRNRKSYFSINVQADGGYILKCANLLEVSWCLQNKWSPIAPFHHRMKFDLEYMDESYIKTITQVHRQLSDPSIDTDERTLLLAKIISICLEAQGPTQELHESMSSDPEVAETLKRRRTTLDQEPEAPSARHSGEAKNVDARTDREVMAPPKSLPKKAKPKGKENMGDNRKEKLKRGNSNEDMNENKKLKKDSNVNLNSEPNSKEKTNKNEKTAEKVQNEHKARSVNTKDNVAGNKNSEIPKIVKKNTVKAADKVENKAASNKNVVERPESGKVVEKTKITKEKSDVAKMKNKQKEVRPEKVIEKAQSNKKGDKVKSIASTEKDKVNAESKGAKDTINTKATEKSKNVASAKSKESTNATSKETVTKKTRKPQDQEANPKNEIAKPKTQATNEEISKSKPNSAKETVKSVKSNEITKKTGVLPKKVLNTEKNVVKEVPKKAEDKTKKFTTIKNKAISESNANTKNTQEKVPTKPIASTKDKAKPNEENNDKRKKAITKNKVNNADKNKESTIEKVVEKSVATKRKSNIVDKEQEGINSAPKIKRKTLSNPEIIRHKDNDALKRKNSLLDRVKEIDSVAKKNTQISAKIIPANNNDIIKKSKTDPIIKMQKNTKNKIESRIKTKLMPGSIRTSIPGNSKVLKAGNTDKQIGLTSKIPQKKLSAISEAALKKNPLRISPRKISKFKTTVDGTKLIQKTTSIPRLLKKPIRKV